MEVFDRVLQFATVVKSSIKTATLDVIDSVLGLGGLEDDDSDGEQAPEQVRYSGALGMVWRVLPPDKLRGKSRFVETLAAKIADGLLPIAWRDERINRAFPAGPKEGTIAMAGYGGGFHSLDLTSSNSGSQKANIHVIYCPYQFDGNGVPAKAHAIVIDPSSGNESITITHGAGYQLSLTKDGFNVNIDSGTFLAMAPGKFTLNAASIILQGNCAIGNSAATAVPITPVVGVTGAVLGSASVALSFP